MKFIQSFLAFVFIAGNAGAQQADSVKKAVPGPQWGIELSYTGMSYTESAVVGIGILHTRKKHAFSLGTHIWHQDLFTHVDTWARFGAAFTYSYFPIGSHRRVAPYLFYDLNYAFLRSRNDVILTTDAGDEYGAVRDVKNHGIAHHFGIGVRGNICKKLFVRIALGAGPGSYGEDVLLRSRQSAYSDIQTSEHPFSHFQPAYMFQFGIAYQIEGKDWKKKGTAFPSN
jgi:hypothetical protein